MLKEDFYFQFLYCADRFCSRKWAWRRNTLQQIREHNVNSYHQSVLYICLQFSKDSEYYNYNTCCYISLNYSTGPKLIHEGVRSYIFDVPRETKNVPVSGQTMKHPGLLRHLWGLIGLLSSKTRHQALDVNSRLKPKTDDSPKRSEGNRIESSPSRRRSEARLSSIGIHPTPQSSPYCLFRIAVKYKNKSSKYQFMQWKIENWLGMETNIMARGVRCIPVPYSIHSRACQRGQPQQPSVMLLFYNYDLILPRKDHEYMLTIIQTPTSEWIIVTRACTTSVTTENVNM